MGNKTKKNKAKTQHNMCWTPLFASKHKKVYKTFAFPQTTGGKEKPNIVVIRKVPQTSQHRTQNVKTHNRTTQKTKKISNTNPTTCLWEGECLINFFVFACK